jgi:hypothetical protein
MLKSNLMNLKLVSPSEVNRTVVPTGHPNAQLRTREHLTAGEVEALVKAAKTNRHGHRDATMILIAFHSSTRPPCQEWHTQRSSADAQAICGPRSTTGRKTSWAAKVSLSFPS